MKTSGLIFSVDIGSLLTFQMAKIILSVFLCSCLSLAVADILDVAQGTSKERCEGSLILTAAEDPTHTRRFRYDPSANCKTQNLKEKLKMLLS